MLWLAVNPVLCRGCKAACCLICAFVFSGGCCHFSFQMTAQTEVQRSQCACRVSPAGWKELPCGPGWLSNSLLITPRTRHQSSTTLSAMCRPLSLIPGLCLCPQGSGRAMMLWAWWLEPVLSALEAENSEFETSLGYIVDRVSEH